jgi:hypothetical protein
MSTCRAGEVTSPIAAQRAVARLDMMRGWVHGLLTRGAERRHAPRYRTLASVRIVRCGDRVIHAVVRDLSESGARLQLVTSAGVPESFRLIIGDGNFTECTVVWRRAHVVGVKFQSIPRTPLIRAVCCCI